MSDPTIITSPLSGPFFEGGVTVDVQIYRLQDTKRSLEVLDRKGSLRQRTAERLETSTYRYHFLVKGAALCASTPWGRCT